MAGVDDLFSFDEPSQEQPEEQLNTEEQVNENVKTDEKRDEASFSPTDPTGKRFEHFQRAWQKEKTEKEQVLTERERLQKELDEINQYKPVIEHIKANPDLLIKAKQPSEPKEPQLVRPSKPERPKSYNKAEALADPESPSAKYEEALIEYNEQLADYITKKDEVRELTDKQRAEAEAKARKEKEAVSNVHALLVKDHGFSNEDASDFIKFMNDPANQKLENYVELYKAAKAKGGTKNAEELERKKKEFETKKKNGENPGGTSVGGGNDAEGIQDKFIAGIKGKDTRSLFELKK